MMLRRFALILLMAFASPVMAQQQVSITADLFTIDETTQLAVFTGNVVVTHPNVTVKAPRVEAGYGEGGTSDIKTFEAFGPGVELITSEQTAVGEHAVFTPADQILRLTGKVVVTNASGTVNADELVHNLETNVSTFTATSGGRVTGIFTSQ